MPGVYAFGEVDGIWQRFNNSIFDTNGYRVLGGIGTDAKNSLVRGEVYGGYQFQHQEQQQLPGFGIPQDSDSPVFGGRVYYYPTPYWTLIASVDEVLSMATILSPTIPFGTPNFQTTALLQTTYGLSRQWSIGGALATRAATTKASTDWILAGWRVRHSTMKFGEICDLPSITNTRPCTRILPLTALTRMWSRLA